MCYYKKTKIKFNHKSIFKIRAGFTLIELLVVISIIGLLASVVLVALNGARVKSRDAKRLADIAQIQKALELYYDKYNQYPPPEADPGCGGWDVSSVDSNNDGNKFIDGLVTAGFASKIPGDPAPSGGQCFGAGGGNEYRYYRYAPQGNCTKYFYVLGVTNIEETSGASPKSPGWSCTGAGARDWQAEFEWVTGKFE